jgi:adenosylcobinamide-phosphate synthase
LLVLAACGLDRLVGDPRWCPHPVVLMGWLISRLRRLAEAWAGETPWRLRLAGGWIALLLLAASGLAGWGLEQLVRDLARRGPLAAGLGLAALTIALASALAGRSLEQAVREVLEAIPPTSPPHALPDSVQAVQNHEAPNTAAPESLMAARQALAWIVGRDTDHLTGNEILRAAAETASENAVDGLFAPLFWMLVGAGLWSLNPALPGPLALAWGFKAASTLDSMLGYRKGKLRWLGTAGARLDDLLVWLPCRLVAFSLPLAAGQPGRCWPLLLLALREGAADPSPNAGVSQAAYGHAARVQLGGSNSYAGQVRDKPLLAADQPAANRAGVCRILKLSRHLALIWLAGAGMLAFITKTLS